MKTRCKSFVLFLSLVEIRFSDIIFAEKDKIGDGAQGTVYKAFWRPQNKDVAVKVLLTISNAGRKEVSLCTNSVLLA